MRLITRTFSRTIVMLLICALIAASAPVAEAKPLTPETVHARILKRGLGNWVGVELQNGTAFVGRIVGVDDHLFSLQLHNDPEITPVLYSDVVDLHTGLTGGQKALFLALPIVFAGVAIGTAVAFRNNEPRLPTMPTQPVFP